MIYLIGSLRNPKLPEIGNILRTEGFTVWDDWFASGEKADDSWQAYENQRGRRYGEALYTAYAQHIFDFDKKYIDICSTGILVMPAGRSGHLELGYMAGQQKDTFILFEQEPDRYDVMYQFCNGVYFDVEDLINALSRQGTERVPRRIAGFTN